MIESILQALVDSTIQPILIGGRAAVAHGLAMETVDWDLVIPKTDQAREAVRLSLMNQNARFRCVDAGTLVPMVPGALDGRQNLRFSTQSGDLDFVHALDFIPIPEIAYKTESVVWHAELLEHCQLMTVHGVKIHVLKPGPLVMSKMVRGHAADIEVFQRYIEDNQL